MFSTRSMLPVVMVLSLVLVQSVNGCPSFCSCSKGAIACSHKSILQIEADKIPKTTIKLDYSNNKLSKISNKHFQGLNFLEILGNELIFTGIIFAPYFFQDGRRYNCRRGITALVGGPGSMAVNLHIVVIPPTAKVLPPKNERSPTAESLPPYCSIDEKIPPYLGFTASAKKYLQFLIPTKEYRQLSIPP